MNTTRKTFALAGALTAALLLSASGASAAQPGQHGNPQANFALQHKPQAQKPQQQAYNNFRDDRGNTNDHRASNDQQFDKNQIRYVSYNHKVYRDRYHRPPMRIEFRNRAPHRGMAYHQGQWRWAGNQWVWMVGTWLMAAQMGH